MDAFVWNLPLLLDNLLAYSRHGRGVKFAVNSSGALRTAQSTLRRYGIKCYGFGMTGNERSWHVRSKQAQWAEWLLVRANTPLTQRPNYPDNANVEAGDMPFAWADEHPNAVAPSVGFAGMFGGSATTPKQTTAVQRRTARKAQRRQRRGNR